MSELQDTLFADLVEQSRGIASKAFRTSFVETSDVLFQKDFISEYGKTVEHQVLHDSDQTTVMFRIKCAAHAPFYLAGVVDDAQAKWIEALTETVTSLIEKEIECAEQDFLLTDYATQISRDFEELVWTREFAKRIQKTDVQQTLLEFVEQVFPTLMETVQATQLVLLEYASPISLSADFPEQEICHYSLGEELLDEAERLYLIGEFLQRGRLQPVVSNHCQSLDLAQLESFILVPIQAHGWEFGWILAVNRLDNFDTNQLLDVDLGQGVPVAEFGSFEAGLMQSTASFLASHANNISLYREKESLLIGILQALVYAIDAKDHYTHGHSNRVARLSRLLAERLGLSSQECDEIYLSGLLHDIGKIGIPDRLLQKQTELTDEEVCVLQQHPQIGYRLLQRLPQISYILPGVLSHHESLDGTGYPDGLVGDQIPLFARIIAVSDSFDAMTTDRPYRRGMSFEEAKEILELNIGPQWDPTIIDTLLSLESELSEIYQRSGESGGVQSWIDVSGLRSAKIFPSQSISPSQ